ncbi:MAG: transcriptional repressor LexA [Armatimonadota bacterium]|jgi:repressor LexA
MESINARQQEILSLIRESILTVGQPPTVRELGLATGLKSSCSVQKHLDALEEKGYISRRKCKYRSIELLQDAATMATKRTVSVPLVGAVAAGTPILAEESVEDYFPLPDALIPRNKSCFALRVKGDSMVNAGILNGDIVVVQQQATATQGDIVVALIGDEATVKTFYPAGASGIRLQPENPALKPIITRDATILGKVILNFRQYH